MVLAAGAGTRLSSVTRGVPKQFWRPGGGASLIEETLRRLRPMCPADRTVIVVGDAQREYVREWPAYRKYGRVVFQPADRGTAAGVLFGLLPVLAAAPDSVVVITPSDHGVADTGAFQRGVLEAVAHVQSPGGTVLFGVEPSAAHADYGWITLRGESRSTGIQPVASFVEKPPADQARRLLLSGAIWNTMVVVARAGDLMDLCRNHLPNLTATFAHSLSMPRRARHAFLRSQYSTLTVSDFSRDVLAPARNLFAYKWPASVEWTDLGTPERLTRWLRPTPRTRVPAEAAQAAEVIAL